MTLVALGFVLAMLLCIGMSACGRSRPAASRASATQRLLNDGDHDHLDDADEDNLKDDDNDASLDYKRDDNGDYHDRDDAEVLQAGRRASPRQSQAVASVVERYLAQGMAGNDAGACALLTPSIERSAPEDYGQGSGPGYLRGGRSCPAILAKVFAHYRSQLASPVVVTEVRLLGDHASVVIGSKSMPASYVSLARRSGSWQVAFIFPSALP